MENEDKNTPDLNIEMKNTSEEKGESDEREEMELTDLDLESLATSWRQQDPNSIT
jgi:hypothetical protein